MQLLLCINYIRYQVSFSRFLCVTLCYIVFPLFVFLDDAEFHMSAVLS